MVDIIASRNYFPGDVIYSEPAFAKVVLRKYKDTVCEFCCSGSFGLRACKECLAVKYCGKNCQKNDWSSHRLECRHLKNLPKGSSADFIRLLGKVILKIQGKDWKVVKSTVLGKDYSFDDIDSHYKEFMENPRMQLFFNEMKELTGKYIGCENLPDDDSFIKILGKVNFNSFRTRILGFYIGVIKFSQECIPNSNVTTCGNTIKVWAFRKIRKGEDKITLPGRMILLPAERFSKKKPGSCKCADCSLPYGESTLFKIIDKKRAFSLICETEKFLAVAEMSSPNILMLPETLELVDCLLREQEGVLGETNYLHMGLLALKCLNIVRDPLENKALLLKLEKIMKSVFAEYYLEMLPIYKALCAINFQLGCPIAAIQYAEKARLMEEYML